MKFSNKQKKALQTVEWFIPDSVDWSYDVVTGLGFTRISNAIQSPDGIAPEEAFFLKSERGIEAAKVTNLARLEALLWGIVGWQRQLRCGGMDLNTIFFKDMILTKNQNILEHWPRMHCFQWVEFGMDYER